MPKLGDKLSVCCSDGTKRTGRITYIHPAKRFAVLEFTGFSGTWRESFFLRHPERECRTVGDYRKIRTSFSPADDKAILASQNIKETAQKLGRPYTTVFSHRRFLRRRIADAKQTRLET